MLKNKGYLLILILFFASCTQKDESSKQITGRGGVVYGSNFKFMSLEKVDNLFPLQITTVYAVRISDQIFQGVLKIDPEGTNVVPCLAKSYTVSPDAKTFTFKLRTGVHFQDDACFPDGKGREVEASDFKYCFEMACSSDPSNQFAWLLYEKIKGGKAYNTHQSTEISGVKIIDKYTFSIELQEPFAGFEQLLAQPALVVYPKEAVEKYGEQIIRHPVGTGPFVLSSMNDDRVELLKNKNYWQQDEFGNQLPYLDTITMLYNKEKTNELLAFRNQKIDLVLEIPVDEIKNVLGSLIEAQEGKNVKHKVQSVNGLNIEYYGFSEKAGVFTDEKVRMAFNLAIDRKALIESSISGDALPVQHGFVPNMDNYPIDEVRGYEFNLDKAKSLMKEAGYPNGEGFPTVELYTNSPENSPSYKMSMAVATSISNNLGVIIQLKSVNYEGRVKAIEEGKAIFWRSGWIADYPDPENFLSLFRFAGVEQNDIINPFGFNSPTYDSLFSRAKKETDLEKRMELYAKCDQIIVDKAVVMPLFTSDLLTMVNLKVKNFEINPMERLDFTKVYIKELTPAPASE